jgi:hypothetical protein
MPTARGGIAAGLVSGCIFVFGGEGNDEDPSGVFDRVEGYDICRARWMEDLPMPNPRHGIGAAVNGFEIILPGGSPVEGFGVTGVVDAFIPGSGGGGGFFRGDANLDTQVELSDSVFILIGLFFPGPGGHFRCLDAADVDDTGRLDITDANFGLNYLFLGGPPPRPPGPDVREPDPTEDALDCLEEPEAPCVDG